MEAHTTLEVIDPNGWRKEYSLEKAIVFIGSDQNNDILLEIEHGAGISPRHLQVIAVPDGGFRLVNLGESAVAVGKEPPQELPPHLSAELLDGDLIKVGEFMLTFRGSVWAAAGSRGHRSQNISINLNMSATELHPHQSLEGHVTITNLGDYAGAQFEVELTGFDPACFELEPGPLLSSGASKEVYFRLDHKGDQPLAGDATITIRVTAPGAYPGEQTSIAQIIRVMPYFAHRLTIPDRARPRAEAKPQPAQPPTPRPERPTPPPPAKAKQAGTPDSLWTAAEKPVKELPPPATPAVIAPPADRPEPPPEPVPAGEVTVEPEPPAASQTEPLPEPEPVPEIIIEPPAETSDAESQATIVSQPEPMPPEPKSSTEKISQPPPEPEPVPEKTSEPLSKPEPAPRPKPKPPASPKPAPRPAESVEPRMDWWTPASPVQESPPAPDLWSTPEEAPPARPDPKESAVKMKAQKPVEPEKSVKPASPDTDDLWADSPESDKPDKENNLGQ